MKPIYVRSPDADIHIMKMKDPWSESAGPAREKGLAGSAVRAVLRDMIAEDLDAVVALERECFAQPWTRAMLAEELREGQGWRQVAAAPSGEVVGFALGRKYPDEWHLMDIAVASAPAQAGCRRGTAAGVRRRRRQGRQAGAARGARAQRRPPSLCTKVTASSALAVRRGYYPDTGENALVMWREPGHAGRAGETGLSGPLLAIESSCDDTAAAVLTPHGEVLSTLSHSQDSIHERYGGVVPEVASRAHVERMTAVVSEALRQAGCTMDDIAGVAATVGPGLIGALLVGVQTAKAIAWARRLPFFPVNHIHGHLAAAWLADPEAPLPMVTLVASGGHTTLIRVDDRSTYTLLGQTLDDAAGEAFDKGARLLGLGYPGGKELDELAEKGDPRAFSFPVAMKRSARPDFSFSGVKTALYYLLRSHDAGGAAEPRGRHRRLLPQGDRRRPGRASR